MDGRDERDGGVARFPAGDGEREVTTSEVNCKPDESNF